jgi:site-specific DNA-methyltransferase (adenine-specific)
MDKLQLYQGDCLELMKGIPKESIDLILCDLPYGTTKNKWDTVIPLEEMWEQYNRIIKKNGAIVLFSDGIFSAYLMQSNVKMWRYNLVWDKMLPSGFLNANRMPLRRHELISVFYKKTPTYNPQKTVGKKNHSKGKPKDEKNNNYGNFGFVDNKEILGDLKHPTSILSFQKPHPSISVHSTQKPVPLLEYLVKTYTNPGDTVLDNCMGSGSTGVACVNTGRKFIGIELEKQYFDIAINRITKAEKEGEG